MFQGIRQRLTLWYVGVLAAILLVTGLMIYTGMTRALYHEEDEELRAAVERTLRVYDRLARHARKGDEEEEDGERAALELSPIMTAVIAPSGEVLYSSRRGTAQVLPYTASLQAAAGERHPQYATLQVRGETLRVYTQPIVNRDRVVALVQAAKPIGDILFALREMVLMLLLASAGAVALAAAGGLFLAERALVPIRQAFQRQRDFVADASHELRTPLSVLRASAEVLQRDAQRAPAGPERDETLELTGNIISETDRMTRLVGDMLTLARADSGELQLDVTALDFTQIARSALRKVQVLARAKQIEMESELPERLPMRGDAGRLEQLLLILLDNAVKYTPPGGRVTLTARQRGKHNAESVELAVSDTGIGIPAADLPHIFERFYRADKARSREQGGTGLGLSIARWIVQEHGGQISAQSSPSQGTTFRVTLPLRQQEARNQH